jgi:hypothetical protein
MGTKDTKKDKGNFNAEAERCREELNLSGFYIRPDLDPLSVLSFSAPLR